MAALWPGLANPPDTRAAESDGARKARLARDLVERANAVPIFDVLEDFVRTSAPRDAPRSWKSYCPFGWEHPDGGTEPAWRTYAATNSSYCFAGHGAMNPVRLVQIEKELRPVQAARLILERYGLLKPRHFQERADELIREMREGAPVVAPQYAVEALSMSLREEEGFDEAQLSLSFISEMERQLAKLDDVVRQSKRLTRDETERLLREWFAGARTRLREETWEHQRSTHQS